MDGVILPSQGDLFHVNPKRVSLPQIRRFFSMLNIKADVVFDDQMLCVSVFWSIVFPF
jgi:hypothetical protein